MKPCYDKDGVTLYCGDNVETLRTFQDACIDLTVTSPPYDSLRVYGGHSWDFEGVSQQLWRVTKPGGVVVWVVADATVNGSETGTSFRQALRFMEIGFRLHDTMIWEKDQISFPDTVRYSSAWEFMFIFSNGKPRWFNPITKKNQRAGTPIYGRERTNGDELKQASLTRKRPDLSVIRNVWRYQTGKNGCDAIAYNHPAPFPEALARDHILSWSNEGDVVLDPFLGSGTTAKMARAMGRQAIGIEVNPEYVEICKTRLAQGVLF